MMKCPNKDKCWVKTTKCNLCKGTGNVSTKEAEIVKAKYLRE